MGLKKWLYMLEMEQEDGKRLYPVDRGGTSTTGSGHRADGIKDCIIGFGIKPK